MTLKYIPIFILACLSMAPDVNTMSYDDSVNEEIGDLPMFTKKPITVLANDVYTQIPVINKKPSKESNSGIRVYEEASSFMATIREAPSETYLCSATFIQLDALITTARCVFRRDVKKIFVHYNSTSLRIHGPISAPVKSITIHPDFEMTPLKNDFSIIKLQDPAQIMAPLKLPNKDVGPPGTLGFGYTWRFTDDMEDFMVHQVPGEIISNSKCFVLEKEIIPENVACAVTNPYQWGTLDHGMPYKVTTGGEEYMFGLKQISVKKSPESVERVWRIEKIVPWITSVLNNSPKKSAPINVNRLRDEDNE